MVVRLLVLNGECVVAASFLFLQTSLCSQKNNISSLSFSSQKSSFCFSKIISPLLWISLKKICFCPLWKKSALCLDPSTKKKKSPLRVLSDPYLYGSTFLLLDILFPFLMHMDMESAYMVAHWEILSRMQPCLIL